MTETEFEAIKDAFATMKSASRPWKFVYVNQGADGKPYLELRRKMTLQQAITIKQKGKGMLMAYGDAVITRNRKGIEFHPTDEPPGRMDRDLKQVLGPTLSFLRHSEIAKAGTEATVEQDQADPTARERMEEADRKASAEQRMIDRSEAHVLEARERAVQAETKRKQAAQRREQAELRLKEVYEEIAKIKETISGLGIFSGKKKEAERKKLTEAENRVADLLRAVYAAAKDEGLADRDIAQAHRAVGSLSMRASDLYDAKLESKAAEQDIGHAEAMFRERQLQEAEDFLTAAVGLAAAEIPALHEARENAHRADEQAEEALSVLLNLAGEVNRVQALLEALEDPESDEGLELQQELAEAVRVYDEAELQAAKLALKADAARVELDGQIAAASLKDEALASALEDRAKAEKLRVQAADKEKRLQDELEQLEEEAEPYRLFTQPEFVITFPSNKEIEAFAAGVPVDGHSWARFDFSKLRVALRTDPGWFVKAQTRAMTVVRSLTPYQEAVANNAEEKFIRAFSTRHFRDNIARELGIEITEEDEERFKETQENGYLPFAEERFTLFDQLVDLGEIERRTAFDEEPRGWVREWVELVLTTQEQIARLDMVGGVLQNIPDLNDLLPRIPQSIGGLRAARNRRSTHQNLWKNLSRGMNAIAMQGYLILQNGRDWYRKHVETQELPEYPYEVRADPKVAHYVGLLGRYCTKDTDLSQQEASDLLFQHWPKMVEEFEETAPIDGSAETLAAAYGKVTARMGYGPSFAAFMEEMSIKVKLGSCAHETCKIVLKVVADRAVLAPK